MNIAELNNVYFIGIGGIGMSAIAQYFHSKGIAVSGYDKASTPISDMLSLKGIDIHYEENVDRIPKETNLVVYTPAIPKDHKELNYFIDNNYKVMKRSEVLQFITKDAFTIAIAGSHGKTTISSMVAHVLKSSNIDCTAFLGGVSVNYKSNFIPGNDKIMVVEADEYDQSFLRLSPDIAVITAIDSDHLDIYQTQENVKKAFANFASKIKSNGTLIQKNVVNISTTNKSTKSFQYSLDNSNSDYHGTNIAIRSNKFHFDIHSSGQVTTDISINSGGRYNIENAIATYAVADQLEISKENIKKGISSFQGVKRRFEYIVKTDDYVYIDDYAHHPEEIKAVTKAARELYPQKELTVVFQPHLYSRTRDLAEGFSEALSQADRIILMPIYPARELPIEAVNSEMLLNQISKSDKQVLSRMELLEFTQNNDCELLMTLGAGDIDQSVETIKNILLEKVNAKLETKLSR